MQSERSKVIYSFSEKEALVWKLVKRWRAVPIPEIYRALRPEMFDESGAALVSFRRQQMYVGAIMSNMNQKLLKIGQKITPAEPRGTYALTRV